MKPESSSKADFAMYDAIADAALKRCLTEGRTRAAKARAALDDDEPLLNRVGAA